MGSRVVEYVLVAGLVARKQQTGDKTGSHPSEQESGEEESESCEGSVLQRFPVEDRRNTPLPRGIEIFCQPLGWSLSPSASPPSLTTFILTAEDGRRLFCSSLTFHQLRKQKQRSSKRLMSVPTEQDVCNVANRRKMMRMKTSPSFDYLDEVNEANWSPESIVNQPKDMYEPLCLCLVSRLPLFDLLQSCLKSLYLSWLSGLSPLEDLVGELLTQFTLPPVNCLPVKKPFGALKELVLAPIHEDSSLPYTSTGAYKLLQSIGVHNMIHIVSTVLSDVSVLFISSSFTALTSAVQSVCALLHPLQLSHSLVPVVPERLLEMVQLPSIYIMGMHSSHRGRVEEMGDVVEVYLDDGRLYTPPALSIPTLPLGTVEPVHRALANILSPGIEFQDHLFGTETLQSKSIELQDKEIRAVFLCLLVSLLGDSQEFVTVLRFHPDPSFAFNKEAYLQSHCSQETHSLLHKIVYGISFMDFIHFRSVPFRKCDFFDELVARYVEHPEDYTPEKLYTKKHIEELAEELTQWLPPTAAKESQFITQGLTQQDLCLPFKVFPHLREKRVEQAMRDYSNKQEGKGEGEGEEEETEDDDCRPLPLLEVSHSQSERNNSPSVQRDLESLRSCLDALFQSKIIEARKYIPMVTQALKQRSVAHSLVPELVHQVMQVGSVLLSSDQFDILVKIINIAVTDTKSAIALLPVSTIMYREINPGVHQHICTYLQHHSIWTKLEFWKNALYSAVQAELVRVYTELELASQNKAPPTQNKAPPTTTSQRRVTTTCVENVELDKIILSDPPRPGVGEITLRSRQRLRSSDPSHLKALRRTALSKSMRMRMRASVILPGVSEGVLPPNAEPVTSQEALHHLAKQLKKWASISEEQQQQLCRQEENAVQNQLILFVQRILQLRIPVEFSGYEEREALKVELLDFIGRFLRLVELELSFDFNRHGKIRDQIKDMIQIHIDSLKGLREELKRRPLSKVKTKVMKPPLLEGETLIRDGIPCYLLDDGRENGLLVPADGHVFVTSYRIMFLGTPCNPQAPNVIVTRSFPIASIFRLKKLQPQPIPQLAILATSGLQMRTVTAELLRIGFDEDLNQQDVKLLIQSVVDLRNPTKITRGLKATPPPSLLPSEMCVSLTASQMLSTTTRVKNNRNKGFEQSNNILGTSDTLTRVKQISDLSRSPCSQQYERMRLGSLNFSASNKGPWKITPLNMTYAVCSSYPAVVVVPEKISDETLISVASQFQYSRFPVVTWKHHSRQAVLLRSGCFRPSASSQKVGPLGLVQSTVLHGKNKFMGGAVKFGHLGGGSKEKGAPPLPVNLGGTGVFNVDVDSYIRCILQLSQNSRRKRHTSNLVQELSGPPEMMHFDPVHMAARGGRGRRVRSCDSDDIDFDNYSPQRRRKAMISDLERSLTPEPQVDRLYASPEPIKKGKRRFSVSNFIQKASPHFGRKKRYKVASTSEIRANSPEEERNYSPGKDSPEIDRRAREMRLPLDESEEQEDRGDDTVAGVTVEGGGEGRGEGGGEGRGVGGGEGRREGGGGGDGRREGEVARISEEIEQSSSSDREAWDKSTPVRKLALAELSARSPTRGIPKFYKHRPTKSLSSIEISDPDTSRDEIDVADINMTEKRESSVSPEASERRKSTIDWEAVENTVMADQPPLEDSRPSTSTPELPTSPDPANSEHIGEEGRAGGLWESRQQQKAVHFPDFEGSPATFSILPTNPRDWITVDALPAQLNHWSDSALYVIGEKAALREVPDDLYPNCMFVPVEVPNPAAVSQCFKKLMRACSPSAPNTSTYLAAVEDSGWINQLSIIMEVAVAVADLIHIQESSVLVCLENGWDATAQVVSLAQILLDPYYRTLEGFQALVEKDWLSFGHRFSQNGNHTTSSNISGFTPIFLQFLDLVHQVMHQFPLSFEFSDFYLRLMAYHHSSMRFHTFTLNTEKERYFCNWLPYRPRHANVHGSSGQSEPHTAFWDFVNSLHSESTLLYNFKYKPEEQIDPLYPHSYQANLDVWSFYLDHQLSQFPPYDTELISESDLTPLDLHYNFFEKEKSLLGQKNITVTPMVVTGMSGIGTLLLEYTALMNLHAQKKSLPSASWRELWEELQESVDTSSPLLPMLSSDRIIQSHRQTLHKRTTVAVLIKGKLAVELEEHFTYPHTFESASLTSAHECDFCKHQVTTKDAFRCKNCGSICHKHCKAKMPYNCGHKDNLHQTKTRRHTDQPQGGPLNTSILHADNATQHLNSAAMDGLLFKRGKIVKNWKLRYFTLDPEKRELSYYESKQMEKCHGTILLTDEDHVDQTDPQPVPALKVGEMGYFFNLTTPKRVYNLMARTNNERAEWIVRIKNALPVTSS